MTDNRSREKSLTLRELEFNDLNIHLYLTLNYGTASEHLDFDFMVLYNAFVLSWGLTITQNSIHRISDLDRSRLSDTRSAENDQIGADTDPEYRIDASLDGTILLSRKASSKPEQKYPKSFPSFSMLLTPYMWPKRANGHYIPVHQMVWLIHALSTRSTPHRVH